MVIFHSATKLELTVDALYFSNYGPDFVFPLLTLLNQDINYAYTKILGNLTYSAPHRISVSTTKGIRNYFHTNKCHAATHTRYFKINQLQIMTMITEGMPYLCRSDMIQY